MTIDDELILELIKPDRSGKVGKDAPIIQIIGDADIAYKLEELNSFYRDHESVIKKELTYISPDIVVSGKFGAIAFELENDVQWDFMESLWQVKNYKRKFQTIVIIPKEYERFAPLYKNEGFKVHLWKANRKWQCLRCGAETIKEGPVIPKCSGSECNNHNPKEFRLVGLKDADIQEYT
jgi:hypothetical protein